MEIILIGIMLAIIFWIHCEEDDTKEFLDKYGPYG